jgi:ribonuclease-3
MFGWLRSRFIKTGSTVTHSNTSENPATQERFLKLEGILGFKPSNLALYEKALRHRSTTSLEQYESYDSYERLEFLGDAVLDLISAELLFEKYPEEDEGFLTKTRAKMVRGETLSNLSKDLGIEALLEFSDTKGGVTRSKGILADIFESLVAAIYITEGYAVTYDFVKEVYNKHLNFDELAKINDNFKSTLLEFAQANKMDLPEYKVVGEKGPGHNRTFDVEVMLGSKVLGIGTGKSKKKAEQAAARNALESLDVA